MVELLAYTQPNPALREGQAFHAGDVPLIWQGKSAFCANLMEFAARLCYASTSRMGTSPSFIAARVREGHEDIIEHAVATFRWMDTLEPATWRTQNRHCEVTQIGAREWVVSGNARVWLQFFRERQALEALPFMRRIAPEVYAEPLGDAAELPVVQQSPNSLPPERMAALATYEDPPLRVTLLGYTQPVLACPEQAAAHGAACFLFEGVSRACTHQLVRHRLASFSQESQRYVDLQKGAWNAVTPPKIGDRPEAQALMERTWEQLQEAYRALRAMGIRKEDARFLLPNATETRIVTAMNFAAWKHFLWLRAVDKAAQWEIRRLGIQVLRMLHAIAPHVFAEHWRAYEETTASG